MVFSVPMDSKTRYPVVTCLSMITYSGKRWIVLADARPQAEKITAYTFPLLVSDTGDIVEMLSLCISEFCWLSFFDKIGRHRVSHKRVFNVPGARKTRFKSFRETVYLGLIRRRPFCLTNRQLRLPRVGDYLVIDTEDASRFGLPASKIPEPFKGRIVVADGWFVGATSKSCTMSFCGTICRKSLSIEGRYHPATSRHILNQDRFRVGALVNGPMRRFSSVIDKFGESGFYRGVYSTDIDTIDEEDVDPDDVNWLHELQAIKRRMSVYWKGHDFFPLPIYSIRSP